MPQFWKIVLLNFQFYDPYNNLTSSIFFPQRWEWDNLCVNSSVLNSHVKPVRLLLSESHFWKPLSGSIPGLVFDGFESSDGHNFWFFSVFLLKTLILFIIFNKWRKQNIILDGTVERNTVSDAEEKKRWILKFSSTKCKDMNENKREALQKHRPLCCLSSLRHSSTIFQ